MAGHDPLLAPLLGARDERERERAIERLLLDVAQPLIEQVVARRSRSDALTARDREDIAATVLLRLLQKLRMLVTGETPAIERFEDYVVALAYNARNDHLRRRYPRLTSLKNQVRYVLTRDPRFALWAHGDDWVAGLAAWRDRRLGVLREAPELAPAAVMLESGDKPKALEAIFRAMGAPLLLPALVRLLAKLWNVNDGEPADSAMLADPGPSPSEQVESREYLRVLWDEIRQLRPNHRKALLLNLRDDETVNVIAILVMTGVASFDEVAAALEMPSPELARLWNDLPLDDLQIAERLGVSRQRVINLRQAARQRLRRHLQR